MKTSEIADKLVAFCREAKWEAAQTQLYADDAISIEAQASPAFAKETKGLAAIIAKGRTFDSMIEKMHALTVSAPLVADNSFSCVMSLDAIMKGRGHVQMSELCVYEVKDGKIVSEQFHM